MSGGDDEFVSSILVDNRSLSRPNSTVVTSSRGDVPPLASVGRAGSGGTRGALPGSTNTTPRQAPSPGRTSTGSPATPGRPGSTSAHPLSATRLRQSSTSPRREVPSVSVSDSLASVLATMRASTQSNYGTDHSLLRQESASSRMERRSTTDTGSGGDGSQGILSSGDIFEAMGSHNGSFPKARVAEDVDYGPASSAAYHGDDEAGTATTRSSLSTLAGAAHSSIASTPKSNGTKNYGSNSPPETTPNNRRSEGGTHKRMGVEAMLPYALLFINFTLNTAGILLMMAGFVTQKNNAINLCDHCSRLTIGPIVVGAYLWLASTYGFKWLRQRNILMLLGYASSLVLVVLSLVAMLITALVFDQANYQNGVLLDNWMNKVRTDPHSLCVLQQRFNCSGYHYTCCRSPLTNFNPSYNISGDREYCFGQNGNIPAEAYWVCPHCPDLILNNTKMCNEVVYQTMRRNLVGFSVILAFAIVLIVLGLLMAMLTRKQRNNRQRGDSTVSLLSDNSE